MIVGRKYAAPRALTQTHADIEAIVVPAFDFYAVSAKRLLQPFVPDAPIVYLRERQVGVEEYQPELVLREASRCLEAQAYHAQRDVRRYPA